MRIPYRLLAPLPLLLAAAPLPPLTPGLWEETLVFALDDINGSSDLAANMQSALPTPAPRRDCRDAGQLADPKAMLMGATGQSCHFTRFDMAGGRIVAAGDCATDGRSMHVEGTGSYTPTGYDFTFAGTGMSGPMKMTFRGRDSGRRIAACAVKN